MRTPLMITASAMLVTISSLPVAAQEASAYAPPVVTEQVASKGHFLKLLRAKKKIALKTTGDFQMQPRPNAEPLQYAGDSFVIN
jgi:hypothetical protein